MINNKWTITPPSLQVCRPVDFELVVGGPRDNAGAAPVRAQDFVSVTYSQWKTRELKQINIQLQIGQVF